MTLYGVEKSVGEGLDQDQMPLFVAPDGGGRVFWGDGFMPDGGDDRVLLEEEGNFFQRSRAYEAFDKTEFFQPLPRKNSVLSKASYASSVSATS